MRVGCAGATRWFRCRKRTSWHQSSSRRARGRVGRALSARGATADVRFDVDRGLDSDSGLHIDNGRGISHRDVSKVRPVCRGYSNVAGRLWVLNRHPVDNSCPVDRDVVDRRQQDTTFQVLKRTLEHNAALRGFMTAQIHSILGRHGPSWAKHATLPVFLKRPSCAVVQRSSTDASIQDPDVDRLPCRLGSSGPDDRASLT